MVLGLEVVMLPRLPTSTASTYAPIASLPDSQALPDPAPLCPPLAGLLLLGR
jgi:hypothetical protein